MSLYVYAIVDRECQPSAELRGLGAGHLSTVGYRSLAAVVSEVPAPLRRETATVLCHEALVEAIGMRHRALPVRFGTVFPDADAVAQALSERYESLAADLVRIGDKVELGLFALWRAPPENAETPELPTSQTPSGDGARYLQARRRAYASAEVGKTAARALARDVDLALRDHTVESRLTVVNEGRLALRAAYLVTPDHVAVIRESVDDLRARRPDVAIVLSGPWPPYSFVSGPPGMDVEAFERIAHAP